MPVQRMCACLLMVLVVAGASDAALQRGPVSTGPGTLAAARKFLEGRWSLLSFEVFPAGQPPVHVKGEGSLVYDSFGNLDVQIRVDRATAERLTLAGVPAPAGTVSIRGRTVIDMQALTLTYFLEGQPPFGAPSGPLALNRPRHWRIEGNVLTLTTKGDDGQPVSVGRWEKTS